MKTIEAQVQDLLAELRRVGLLNMYNQEKELVDLVSIYGAAYEQYGELRSSNVLDMHTVSTILVPDTNIEVPEYELRGDQPMALAKLTSWIAGTESYFVLQGFAGTGKTFLMRILKTLCRDVVYTAPTNKAAKVLAASVGQKAVTTYSALGLRMEAQDDTMVLTVGSRVPYYPRGSIVVVDETSQVGSLLTDAIVQAVASMGVRIIFVGDPAQLPPVGEIRSPAWRITRDPECRALMKHVIRNDSQLLTLATAIRGCIKDKNWESPLRSDHDDTKGVWKWGTRGKFIDRVLARLTCPEDAVQTKVIAWRNKTVDEYNGIIRKHLGFTKKYCVGDQMLLARPLKQDDTIIAHTDDDFGITDVRETSLHVHGIDVPVYELAARQIDGDWAQNLYVPQRRVTLDDLLNRLSRRAKASKGVGRKLAWQEFWAVHDSFHDVRYGYAFTAHRAQGSTVTNVWVDQQDTLSNQNSREAFQCFYVQATRPTTQLHSF